MFITFIRECRKIIGNKKIQGWWGWGSPPLYVPMPKRIYSKPKKTQKECLKGHWILFFFSAFLTSDVLGQGHPGRGRSPLPPGDRTDRTGRDGTDGRKKLAKKKSGKAIKKTGRTGRTGRDGTDGRKKLAKKSWEKPKKTRTDRTDRTGRDGRTPSVRTTRDGRTDEKSWENHMCSLLFMVFATVCYGKNPLCTQPVGVV